MLPVRVSIHARPHGRAMLPNARHPLREADGFNPRPASRSGDAGCRIRERSLASVSIHARPHGRAMPCADEVAAVGGAFQSTPGLTVGRCCQYEFPLQPCPCFNPRPASRSGDARYGSSDPRCLPCFNPRPASRSGDARTRPARVPTMPSFNPRPASRSGDARRRQCSVPGCSRFNPRPASRSGDA